MDIIWVLFRAFLDQIVFNTIGLIVVMFVVCMVLHRPGMGFKFFLFWLAVCAAVFYFVDPSAGIWGFLSYFFVIETDSGESGSKPSKPQSRQNPDDELPEYRIYENGEWKVKNPLVPGYIDSEGRKSWTGMFDEEHRPNGEIIMDNAYIRGRRDIYKDNVCIGYEYEDALGITHRVDYQ